MQVDIAFLDSDDVLGCAKFVGKDGLKKPSDIQASELTFERKSEHMGTSYKQWKLRIEDALGPAILLSFKMLYYSWRLKELYHGSSKFLATGDG